MIKKITPIVIVGILIISGLGAVAIPDGEPKTFSKIESISLSEPVFMKNGEDSVTDHK